MRLPRNLTAIAALAAASTVLAACGSDDSSTTAAVPNATEPAGHGSNGHDDASSPVADDARRIEVAATIQGFDPEEITAEAGEDLAIVLSSEDMIHDFTIDELDAHVAADVGEAVEGGVHAEEPGTYTYYCSVPGHREAGMEGTLTVTG